ncbi:hypothetical protein C8R46DRAFT_1348072 [Mycena filopes]|nr:hypothetical protein C8R46DRAFT_1348072 [Mycena filopes]
MANNGPKDSNNVHNPCTLFGRRVGDTVFPPDMPIQTKSMRMVCPTTHSAASSLESPLRDARDAAYERGAARERRNGQLLSFGEGEDEDEDATPVVAFTKEAILHPDRRSHDSLITHPTLGRKYSGHHRRVKGDISKVHEKPAQETSSLESPRATPGPEQVYREREEAERRECVQNNGQLLSFGEDEDEEAAPVTFTRKAMRSALVDTRKLCSCLTLSHDYLDAMTGQRRRFRKTKP